MFAALRLGIIGLALSIAQDARAFRERTVPQVGKVLRLDRGHAFVEFTVDGRRWWFTDRRGDDPPRHSPGEPVSVPYDPAWPANARVDEGAPFETPMMVGGFGAIFLMIGAFVALRAGTDERRT